MQSVGTLKICRYIMSSYDQRTKYSARTNGILKVWVQSRPTLYCYSMQYNTNATLYFLSFDGGVNVRLSVPVNNDRLFGHVNRNSWDDLKRIIDL